MQWVYINKNRSIKDPKQFIKIFPEKLFLDNPVSYNCSLLNNDLLTSGFLKVN